MTTVCWDGNTLAADTLYTAGGRKMQGHYEKILFPEDKQWTVEGKKVLAFGFSGAIGSIQKIKSLMEAGITSDTEVDPDNSGFNILMVTEHKQVYNWTVGQNAQKESVKDLFVTDGNFAIGSGGIYGLGVMAIKGDSISGVKAGIKVDIHSGGYIDVWSFDTPKTLTRINPTSGEIISTKQPALPSKKKNAILCAPGG